MSRSFKKNPVVKDNHRTSKENKQLANRIIRRKLKNHDFEMGNGCEYQKHYESWEIHDQRSRWTLREALKSYREPENESWANYWKDKYPTEKEFVAAWKKEMIGK